MIEIGDVLLCKLSYKNELSKGSRYLIQTLNDYTFDDLIEFSFIDDNDMLNFMDMEEYETYFEDIRITKRNEKINKLLDE